MPESAAEMARQYGLDGKAFRRALRAEGFSWHRLGECWDPPEGSPEYQEMLWVAERLAGDRPRRTAVRVKTPMQQINRMQYEENILPNSWSLPSSPDGISVRFFLLPR